jgi:hypothetical protein
MELNILRHIAYIFFEGRGLCVFELMPLLHKLDKMILCMLCYSTNINSVVCGMI